MMPSTVWRSENNFQEGILDFHNIGLRDLISVVRLVGKGLYY